MILLLGSLTDPVMRYFTNFLVQNKHNFCIIDQNKIGKTILFHPTHWVLEHKKTLAHEHLSAVFNRLLTPPSTHKKNMLAQLYDWLDCTPITTLNRPWQTMNNSSKMMQLNLLPKTSPLKKPTSLICANAHFCPTQKVIFKSASAIRSIVAACPDKKKPSIAEPVLFQEHIIGTNIRVHVIGTQALATEIKSTAIDYRYHAHSRFQSITLPCHIAQACISFAQACHLSFAGIDLIKKDQDYFVLEANPSPGYAYFEAQQANQDISHALYNFMEPN
jgi:glutathione synthase/RimK-type ligase-like ATP-grasp enzyme